MKTKVNNIFGNSIMDPETQFPGVVDLNVNGFEYRALLSTLTKHENSLLAAMFTGQRPVYKDKDGRYFLEANGSTFHVILHYLRYDEISFTDMPNYSGSLFGGGGRRGGFYSHNFSDADLKAIYADSVNLGLSSLVQQLEQYQAILADRKMKEYRKSVNCYDEVLNKILLGIPSDVFFYETTYTLRLDQDFQTTYQDKCCEHDCKPNTVNVFPWPQTLSVDETVKAPCEVTLTLLSSFVKDLQQIGYCVKGLVTSCGFCCQKDVKQSSFFLSSNKMKNCCGEQMLLLVFKFGSDLGVVSYPSTFGQKQTGFGTANYSGFCFGQPNVQKGQGLFGSTQNNSALGNTPGSESGSDVFGQGQSSSNTFGFGSEQSHGFGSKQSQGFGFGSQQSQGFGSKQPQGFGFGSQQSQEFGSQQSQGFGSQQSQGFGSQQSQGFGSQQPQGSGFGSQKPQGFGAGKQQQQGCSFGSQQPQGFGFGSQQKQGLIFGGSSSAGPQQSQDAPAGFGLSGTENKATSGFGSFGTAQQPQSVVGLDKTTSSGSFGKPASTLLTPRLGSTSADVQKQRSTPSGLQSSSKPDSTKAPVFSFAGVMPTTTSSGSSGIFSTQTAQTTSGFSFNSNQQSSPHKKPSHVFGGSASFSSPIKMSSLGSLFEGAKLENVLPVSVDVDKAEDSKQDADKKEDSPTVADNVNDM